MKGTSKGRPRGGKGKMTQAQINVFLRESTKKILSTHMSYTEFIKWSVENYPFGEKQAQVYWKKIWEGIRERFRLEKDKLVNKHLSMYWDIYDRCVEDGDMNGARMTLNDIAKLMGLNEPDKVDVNSVGTITFKFGDED